MHVANMNYSCVGRQIGAKVHQAQAFPRKAAAHPAAIVPVRNHNILDRPGTWHRPGMWQVRKVLVYATYDTGMGMDPELKKSIDDLISNNKIVVFMKGTRQFPQCGFSNNVVQILNVMGAQYETVDILADSRLRTGMKEYSQWPTFPQVYINGEFFGGCDIMIEAYQSGELKEILEVALNS